MLRLSILFSKILGGLVAVLGVALLLTAVGLGLGVAVHVGSALLDLVLNLGLGLVFLVIGVFYVRGGAVTL